MNPEKTIKQVWQEFWKDIVEKDGVLDLEQVKKELYDWWYCMQEVPKVYTHITGNLLSKPLYKAEVVIDKADWYYEKLYEQEIAEARKEEFEEGFQKGEENRQDEINELKDKLKQADQEAQDAWGRLNCK